MKKVVSGPLLLLAFCLAFTANARDRVSFNDGWKFARFGDMPDGSYVDEPRNLENVNFDDSSWRSLNVPHDWGIEGPFRMDLPNRTGKLPYAGIGWYRKRFNIPESDQGKNIFVDFDGAMSDSSIYLNGKYVGEWPYGYTSFRMDLTDHVKFGGENLIAVRLDNKPLTSRFYPGGGIYRNVWLVKTNPTHIANWGVFVTTPLVTEKFATVKVETAIEGKLAATAEVTYAITEEGSDIILATGKGKTAYISLNRPKLWDLDTPHLYTMHTKVSVDGKEVDYQRDTFGVRTIQYTVDDGFLLNGRRVYLKGVAMHHDLGPLGTAVNKRAMERQIEILKEFGVNSIRTAHKPHSPGFLDLCDRMGILVQVEFFDTWARTKTINDYSRHFWDWHERDTVNMVRRDRNHPSVICWAPGSEKRETQNPAEAWISQMLTDITKREDPSRVVSFGGSRVDAGFNGFQHTADIFALSHHPELYAKFREKNPQIPVYTGETGSMTSSRGEYFFPIPNDSFTAQGGYFQASGYDIVAPKAGHSPDIEFAAHEKYPWLFGQYVWCGFDYFGEPTPYNKDTVDLDAFTDPKDRARIKKELDALGGDVPPRSSYFGIVDLCGFPKDRYYMYQAHWRPDLPMAHILPHWNWPERIGKTTPVHVYTSGDEAELFLNGKSLGRKKKGAFQYRLRWDETVYEPGELVVVAYKEGKEWTRNAVRTTGKPRNLSLSVDRNRISADGHDLAFVTVDVVDDEGLLVPRTHNTVTYSISGPGEIIAVASGNPVSHESFHVTTRKVFNGKALVIIRSIEGKKGRIKLVAESETLSSNSVEITTTY